MHRRFGLKRELSRRRAHLAGNAVFRAGLDPANQISRSLGSRDSYRVLAEAAPPGAAAKTGHHRLRQARRNNPKRMHRYGTPSLGTSREELQSSSPSGFPERISVTPIRRNPPCNSFSTCRNMELVLRWVFGNGLQDASVAPSRTFLRPKSPALLASRATRRATALERRMTPGTPRAYLQ